MTKPIFSPDESDEGADWIKLSPTARAERLTVDLALGGVEVFLDSLAVELRRHMLPVPQGIKRPSYRSVVRCVDALGLKFVVLPKEPTAVSDG